MSVNMTQSAVLLLDDSSTEWIEKNARQLLLSINFVFTDGITAGSGEVPMRSIGSMIAINISYTNYG